MNSCELVISVVCFLDCRSPSQASSTASICSIPGVRLQSHLGISLSVFEQQLNPSDNMLRGARERAPQFAPFPKSTFKSLPFRKLSELIPNVSNFFLARVKTSLQEISYFQFPSFMDLSSIPSVIGLKRFSCVFLFSNSGLDASVVRCQVALFPSRWLCDSLKMRKEDNELSLHND